MRVRTGHKFISKIFELYHILNQKHFLAQQLSWNGHVILMKRLEAEVVVIRDMLELVQTIHKV